MNVWLSSPLITAKYGHIRVLLIDGHILAILASGVRNNGASTKADVKVDTVGRMSPRRGNHRRRVRLYRGESTDENRG